MNTRRTHTSRHFGASLMRSTFPARALVAALALSTLAACSDDDNGGTSPNVARTYNQVERLGNPLVSEVFFMKRDHGLHNSTAPATDVANGFGDKIKAFTNAFNRGPTIANTLAAVLVPDMLMVYPNRAGWLSWALAAGYGGRKLQDDVVDAGLGAIFGRVVDPNASVVTGLTSDNISTSTRTYQTTFPYLENAR
jgi:Domain of unknown function (DUF4331)